MTREEAIKIIDCYDIGFYDLSGEKIPADKLADAFDMAIEALSEPKTIIGIDIPYGSDKGLATVFKGKNDKLILEEVKEIMSVVRCKDCRWYEPKYKDKEYDCPQGLYAVYENDFCSHGERREPKGFTADEWYRDTFKGEDK